MTRTAFFAFSLAASLGLSPAALAEVALPDGSGNNVGTSCSDGVTTLETDGQSWPLVDGKLVAAPAAVKSEWGLMCKMSNGFSKVSTTCYDAGHVVAGRSGDDLKVACYEGPVPANLK